MDDPLPMIPLSYASHEQPPALSPTLPIRVLAAIIAVGAFGEAVWRLWGMPPTIWFGEPWEIELITIAISLLEAIAAISTFQLRESGRRLLVVMLAIEIIMHLIGSRVAYHPFGSTRWQKANALTFALQGLYRCLVPAIEWWFFRQLSVVRFFRGEDTLPAIKP